MSTETTSRIVFRTGKLVSLCPIHKADATLLAQWINDHEVTQYLMRALPATIQEEEQWVDKLGCDEKNVVLGIALLDGTLIGTMALHNISWINRNATSGALIGDSKFRGKGYGTEAKMLLLDYAFNSLGLHKVSSTVFDFNGRSQRYNEKCGYVVEGVQKEQVFKNGRYRDLIMMAVFREDWLPLWEEWQRT